MIFGSQHCHYNHYALTDLFSHIKHIMNESIYTYAAYQSGIRTS